MRSTSIRRDVREELLLELLKHYYQERGAYDYGKVALLKRHGPEYFLKRRVIHYRKVKKQGECDCCEYVPVGKHAREKRAGRRAAVERVEKLQENEKREDHGECLVWLEIEVKAEYCKAYEAHYQPCHQYGNSKVQAHEALPGVARPALHLVLRGRLCAKRKRGRAVNHYVYPKKLHREKGQRKAKH